MMDAPSSSDSSSSRPDTPSTIAQRALWKQYYPRPGYKISILLGTNSTISNILGVGRSLNWLLSSGGRRLDSLFLRAAEILGNTPYAVLYKIAVTSEANHRKYKPTCTFQVYPDIYTLWEDPFGAAQAIIDAKRILCTMCHNFFSLHTRKSHLLRLLKWAR